MMRTRLTDRFGAKLPIMSAPMSLHSNGGLAGAVCQAGAIGLFGGSNLRGEGWLRKEIAVARDLAEGGPFGVGLITHLLEQNPEPFEVSVDERVPVIALSFADPSPWLERAREAGCEVVCQVQTVAAADRAAELGAGVLVAQGNAAGGHTGSEELMPFLARVLADHPHIPVLAAGGISNGAKLAEVLRAGADGAWIGTPLLATVESTEVTEDYKHRLVEAGSGDTVYTRVFDTLDPAAFGIPAWPDGIAARVVKNAMVNDWHDRIDALERSVGEIVPSYLEALKVRDTDRTAIYAGVSVDDIRAVRTVREVLEAICAEAERLFR